ncbi:MAG TPA: DUF4407 domain-containing protein [Puia sp.]|nr:DUF4407 domain-containing protein [Puia sp.]
MDRHRSPGRRLLELFCRLSGEDYQLIGDSGKNGDLVRRFGYIGMLVLSIFVLSFYSSTHFISHLLNGNPIAATPVGIVWGLMMVVIYQLLLFTITPAMLIGRERSVKGQPKPVTTEKKGLARVSLIFRISFVVLIAIVVAQPLLVTLFDTSAELDRYRHKYRSEFIVQADSSLISLEAMADTELQRAEAVGVMSDEKTTTMLHKKIGVDLQFMTESLQTEQEISRRSQKKGYRVDTLEDRLAGLVAAEEKSDSMFLLQYGLLSNAGRGIHLDAGATLADLVRKKIRGCRRLDALLSSNNFYTRKVQLVNSHHPLAWVTTLLVIFVFVLPVALKYRIRNRTEFYKEKKKLEEGMVRREYERFKGLYTAIFRDKHGIGVQFYESCIDPPFNTKKIEEVISYTDERVLLNTIYPDGEESEKHKYMVSETISR